MKTKKFERPRDARFSHNKRGELSHNDMRFPCLIQDISANGVFIICARDLAVGQILEASFDLMPERLHRCKIRVLHVEHGCFGAEMIDAGEQENKVFHRYIEKRFNELKRR